MGLPNRFHADVTLAAVRPEHRSDLPKPCTHYLRIGCVNHPALSAATHQALMAQLNMSGKKTLIPCTTHHLITVWSERAHPAPPPRNAASRRFSSFPAPLASPWPRLLSSFFLYPGTVDHQLGEIGSKTILAVGIGRTIVVNPKGGFLSSSCALGDMIRSWTAPGGHS